MAKRTPKKAGADDIMALAELKRILAAAKRGDPASWAIALSKDKEGIILLDKRKRPKQLLADLKKQAIASGLELEGPSLRFGHAMVDTDADARLLTLSVNKDPLSAMRPKLLEHIRKVGFGKIEFMVDAGLESESEQDDTAAAAPAQNIPAGQDAAGLTKLLIELVKKRLIPVIHSDPKRSELLKPLAAQAQASLKAGDLSAAAGAIRALQGELDRFHAAPPAGEIAMPADNFSVKDGAAVVKPLANGLLSMDYSGPAACGGRRCVTDDEIYGSLEKSRLEDAQAERDVIALRKVRVEDLKDLQADVERTQRGTREHRHAVERLDTFRKTGEKPRPYVNYDGGPGPENIGFGALAAAGAGGAAIMEGLALLSASQMTASLTYTAATATEAVASNPLAYAGAAIAYGVVMPPGSPDLPGPFDDVGKALHNLGVMAEDVEQFAKGGKVWGDIARGEAKILPYFKYAGGKLTAGILSAHWHNDKAGIIRAFFALRQQGTALAKALGAKVMRLEADVVMNTETLLPSLLEMGFKPIEESPGSYFLEIVVR